MSPSLTRRAWLGAAAPAVADAAGRPRIGRAPGRLADLAPEAPSAAALTRLFGARPIEDGAALVTIEMPLIAEDGAAVPITVEVKSPMTAEDHVKAIHILAEKNPRPLRVKINLTPAVGEVYVATHRRPADSGPVRVGAAISDGALRAATRRSGSRWPGARPEPMADIGRVKLAGPGRARRGRAARVRALVVHPQERVERQGARWADRNDRFVNRIVVTYLGREIVRIEPSTAIRENSTFTMPFRATETGWLEVTFFDTHGGKFEDTAEVTVT